MALLEIKNEILRARGCLCFVKYHQGVQIWVVLQILSKLYVFMSKVKEGDGHPPEKLPSSQWKKLSR